MRKFRRFWKIIMRRKTKSPASVSVLLTCAESYPPPLERNVKKYDLQLKQLKDTEKRDKYRIWGELLNTYGYSAQPGDKSLEAVNYYNGEPVTIPSIRS